MPLYTLLRSSGKTNVLLFALIALLLVIGVLFFLGRELRVEKLQQKKLMLFSLGLFIIPLFPFLGLGNITSRYDYLSSAGVLVFFFSLLQPYLQQSKKNVKDAVFAITLIGVVLYAGYNLFELQRINKDWQQAGTITNNTISTVSQEFINDEELPKNAAFYFVNVPIRYGEAWVFPVGLADAMWVPFQNEKLQVKQFATVQDAQAAVTASESTRIFVFDAHGKLSTVPVEASNANTYVK